MISSCFFNRLPAFLLVLAFAPGLFAIKMRGQEALRSSTAGEEAAEARRKANAMPGYYNLKTGDLQLRLQSTIGIEANDNVTLAATNEESDLAFSPELGVTVSYPISQANTFNLSLDAGYTIYLNHQDLDRFFVRPGTELSFDIYIKDVLINLHDRVSVINQAYQNSAVGGVGDYIYLENFSGVSATWDLDKLQISSGYDHTERASLNSSITTQNGTEELFFANAALRLNSTAQLGAEVSAGLIGYEQASLNGGVQYSAGLFYKQRLSQYLSARLSGGYFIYNLDSTGVTTNNNFKNSINSLYGSVNLTHFINSQVNYSLEAGHQIQTGLFSDTLDLYYARVQANWGIVRKFPITTSFSYEDGSETGGLAEKIERVGFGAGVSRVLTRKLNTSLCTRVIGVNPASRVAITARTGFC